MFALGLLVGIVVGAGLYAWWAMSANQAPLDWLGRELDWPLPGTRARRGCG